VRFRARQTMSGADWPRDEVGANVDEPIDELPMEGDPVEPDPAAIPALVESLLFVAAGPTPVGRLAQVLDIGQQSSRRGLSRPGSGLQL